MMLVLGVIWNWIIGHSAKQLMYAGAFLAIGLFAAYEINHQRNIGYDECKAENAKADAAAQLVADKAAAPANAQIHANVDQILAPLPDYLHAYQDKSKASDCPDVPYIRKIKVKP